MGNVTGSAEREISPGETEKCKAFFSGSRVFDPCAVQLHKLVARSAKSPRRRFHPLKDEKRSFESRRHSA